MPHSATTTAHARCSTRSTTCSRGGRTSGFSARRQQRSVPSSHSRRSGLKDACRPSRRPSSDCYRCSRPISRSVRSQRRSTSRATRSRRRRSRCTGSSACRRAARRSTGRRHSGSLRRRAIAAPPKTRKRTAAPVALLDSKLRPPGARQGIVTRPALVERLRSRPRQHTVVRIETAAGYGKTTLAAEWSATERRGTGWYTLDDEDNDPAVFLTYLASAFARAGGPLDEQRLRGLRVPAVVAELTAALAKLRSPVVIVLDNVQELRDPVCLGCVGAIAAALPPGSQLALVGRSPANLPPLDERTLRLTTHDFRLSDDEAALLVAGVGLEVGESELRELNEQCAGWATGLFLIARAGRHAVDRLPIGVDRFVDDYFQLEVLGGLDEKTRTFLPDAAVVDRVCGPLCDAMTGGRRSAARLAELAAADLFVEPLEGAWFELHPLLRALLRSKRFLDRDRARALLARAADWHEKRGELEPAVECAIAAGDSHRVAA